MVIPRSCQHVKEGGARCMAPPMQGGDLCFWHDPEHQQEAAEARRLGGLRRRREGAVVGAYEVGQLDNVEDLRRLLQIAVIVDRELRQVCLCAAIDDADDAAECSDVRWRPRRGSHNLRVENDLVPGNDETRDAVTG